MPKMSTVNLIITEYRLQFFMLVGLVLLQAVANSRVGGAPFPLPFPIYETRRVAIYDVEAADTLSSAPPLLFTVSGSATATCNHVL